MIYRTLGRTGLEVSVIGLGTYQFGGDWGHDFTAPEVRRIVARARDEGINLIDTAECYGDHLSEHLIGEAIPASERDDWIIATKFGHIHRDGATIDAWGVDEVLAQLDESLRALATDHVDLYQFHSGADGVFDNDDLWTALDEQVTAGKVRYLGLSVRGALTESGDRHQVEAARSRNISVLQVVYNRLFPKAEEWTLPFARVENLGVIARIPLARGYLSGRYDSSTRFAPNDMRSGQTRDEAGRLLARVEELRDDVPDGVDPAQWALAWVLRHRAVACTVVGTRNEGQIASSARASDLLDDRPPAEITPA